MRLALTVLLSVSLAAFPCLAQQAPEKPAAATSENSPSQIIADARERVADGDGLEAISLLDGVLKANTNLAPEARATALYLRGVAYYKENNAFAALRDFRAAVSEPQLPGAMQKSAAAAIKVLIGHVSPVVGGVHGEGYSYQVRLTLDDLRQREKMIEENRSDTEPDARSEMFGMLAHEYASRGHYDAAKRMAAKSMVEALASKSDFRIGATHMIYYQIAEMQADGLAAAAALNKAFQTFEDAGMLRTAPGYLSDLINKAESRGNALEACRHRENLNKVYVRIDGADLKEDAEKNLAAMRERKCPVP